MPFLSTDSLKKLLPNVVKNGTATIDVIAIELSLGEEVFITGKRRKQKLKPGEQIDIPPGQFALLITEEELDVPVGNIGFIAIKFGLKKRGLVNISGFHVDPGYKGKLKYSVYNAGTRTIHISRGAKVFRLWLSTLDGEAKPAYDNTHEHFGQNLITDSDVSDMKGQVASPAVLKRKLDSHAGWWRIAISVAIILAGPFMFNSWWPEAKKMFSDDKLRDRKIPVVYRTIDSIGVFVRPTFRTVTPDSVLIWYNTLTPESETLENNGNQQDSRQQTLDEKNEPGEDKTENRVVPNDSGDASGIKGSVGK